MEELERLLKQWQNEEGKNQNTRQKIINQIHLYENNTLNGLSYI